MRSTLVSVSALLVGCARTKSKTAKSAGKPQPASVADTGHTAPGAASAGKPGTLIVTPDTTLTGKVVRANADLRYVVLNFPIGRLPSPAQTLFVYRNGLKVGEVRIDDRWRRDDNVVADVIAGEVQAGDEARDR